MSRAFVKDSDDDLAASELPERPLPAHANYVTPRGLDQLHARVRELQEQHERLAPQAAEDSEAKQKLRVVERDLRYFNAQLERADRGGSARPAAAKRYISAPRSAYTTSRGSRTGSPSSGTTKPTSAPARSAGPRPLAKAMIGARVGDTVVWRRPAGETEVEIVDIGYPAR